MQVDPLRGIGNLVYVPPLSKVSGKRSNVTNLHDGVEPDVLLYAARDVISCRGVGVDFDGADTTGRVQRGADEVYKVVNVTEIDCECTLQRRVATQAAGAARAAADPRSVIDPAHHPKNRLTLAGKVPSQPDSRLP